MKKFQIQAGLWIVLAALVALVTMQPVSLHAQTVYGSITGTVTDSSGAVVPGAAVTITNLGTSESRTDKADASGNYRFVSTSGRHDPRGRRVAGRRCQ